MSSRCSFVCFTSFISLVFSGFSSNLDRTYIFIYFVYYLLFTLDDIVLCLPQLCLCEWHSLIIPKSHFPSLEATLPSVIAAMCSKVPFISSAIVKATGSDSFNLLVNNGEAAGQVIFHVSCFLWQSSLIRYAAENFQHIYIIPRKARDCLWASEESLSRLLGEVPYLPTSVLKLLESMCSPEKCDKAEKELQSGDRVMQGLSTIWSLILLRPPFRDAYLKIAVQVCSLTLNFI
ncbi:hypothetical protein UlMin_013009 [Ulmus minor]